jgi:hypothetical protein
LHLVFPQVIHDLAMGAGPPKSEPIINRFLVVCLGGGGDAALMGLNMEDRCSSESARTSADMTRPSYCYSLTHSLAVAVTVTVTACAQF